MKGTSLTAIETITKVCDLPHATEVRTGICYLC